MIDSESLFVIYLTAVRLGTIVAGVMAIRYGYRLFAAGVFKADMGAATTEMAGRVGNYELKFKTGAPGAVLGLFGVMIIVITIGAAPPELMRKKTIKQEGSGEELKRTVETTERMRGEDVALNRLLEKAAEYRQTGQTARAIGAYQQAIQLLAKPMNELARLYMKSQRFEEARVLAEVVVMMNPSDPDFAITFEEIKDSMGGK